MGGSRLVLVKVVLFHLRWPGYPQENAKPNLFTYSKSFILEFSNEVLNFSKLGMAEEKSGINQNQSCIPCGYCRCNRGVLASELAFGMEG